MFTMLGAKTTYTKVLDVGQDMVIEGEVVAGDNVDTSVLLDLPVGETEPLGLGEEVGLGELATPVCGREVRKRADRTKARGENSQASVAFFRSRRTPMRGNPRTADWTILTVELWFRMDREGLMRKR